MTWKCNCVPTLPVSDDLVAIVQDLNNKTGAFLAHAAAVMEEVRGLQPSSHAIPTLAAIVQEFTDRPNTHTDLLGRIVTYLQRNPGVLAQQRILFERYAQLARLLGQESEPGLRRARADYLVSKLNKQMTFDKQLNDLCEFLEATEGTSYASLGVPRSERNDRDMNYNMRDAPYKKDHDEDLIRLQQARYTVLHTHTNAPVLATGWWATERKKLGSETCAETPWGHDLNMTYKLLLANDLDRTVTILYGMMLRVRRADMACNDGRFTGTSGCRQQARHTKVPYQVLFDFLAVWHHYFERLQTAPTISEMSLVPLGVLPDLLQFFDALVLLKSATVYPGEDDKTHPQSFTIKMFTHLEGMLLAVEENINLVLHSERLVEVEAKLHGPLDGLPQTKSTTRPDMSVLTARLQVREAQFEGRHVTLSELYAARLVRPTDEQKKAQETIDALATGEKPTPRQLEATILTAIEPVGVTQLVAQQRVVAPPFQQLHAIVQQYNLLFQTIGTGKRAIDLMVKFYYDAHGPIPSTPHEHTLYLKNLNYYVNFVSLAAETMAEHWWIRTDVQSCQIAKLVLFNHENRKRMQDEPGVFIGSALARWQVCKKGECKSAEDYARDVSQRDETLVTHLNAHLEKYGVTPDFPTTIFNRDTNTRV